MVWGIRRQQNVPFVMGVGQKAHAKRSYISQHGGQEWPPSRSRVRILGGRPFLVAETFAHRKEPSHDATRRPRTVALPPPPHCASPQGSVTKRYYAVPPLGIRSHLYRHRCHGYGLSRTARHSTDLPRRACARVGVRLLYSRNTEPHIYRNSCRTRCRGRFCRVEYGS